MRKVSKITIKSYDAFPHEYDKMEENNNHTIEDNLKLDAEIKSSFRNTPEEKWKFYQSLVTWVCFCDVVGIKINDRNDVFELMKSLWLDVKRSKLYKK